MKKRGNEHSADDLVHGALRVPASMLPTAAVKYYGDAAAAKEITKAAHNENLLT